VALHNLHTGTPWVKSWREERIGNRDLACLHDTNLRFFVAPVSVVVRNTALSLRRWLRNWDEETLDWCMAAAKWA